MLPVAILSGGLATRLRPITEKLPKALIDIRGQPFIAHQLRLLEKSGFRNVVICAGYLGEMIYEVVGDGNAYGLSVQYSFDEQPLLGTGGAIRKALPLLGVAFFTLYGDSYLPCDYLAIQTFFESINCLSLMTVYHNFNTWDASNVVYENGRILAYDKKNHLPGMDYIDYGLGLFYSSVFARYQEDVPFDLATVYQDEILQGDLVGYEIRERFYEVGSLVGIIELRKLLG
jgi:N-acetyl-alpha-D-muramate 1-phosphate uridylyltransferase